MDVPLHLWDKCLAYIHRFIAEASRLLTRCRGVGESGRRRAGLTPHPDPSFLSFLADDFLRLMLCRYIFCDVLLRIHRAFKVAFHR